MMFKQSLMLIAAVAALFAVATAQEENTKFLELLARSSDSSCYTDFQDSYKSLVKTSKQEDELCNKKCEDKISSIEDDKEGKRDVLILEATQSRKSVNECKRLGNAKNCLECLSKATLEGSINMNSIRKNSSRILVDSQESINTAKQEKRSCTTDNRKAFETQLAKLSAQLQQCVKNENK